MRHTFLLFILWGLISCQETGNKRIEVLKRTYDMAQAAQDRETSIAVLTEWIATDSAVDAWVIDSLAYFHYFYKVIPGVVRSPETPKYYTEMGLKRNPQSVFLRDIKAKLLLEEGKDTLAYAMFESMWKETKDPTFFWDLTWIQIARGLLREADTMINMALSDTSLKSKKVAMEHIQAQITENVSTEPAFLFLKYQLLVANRNIAQGELFLQKALELEPNFYAARRSMIDLQRMRAQAQR
jgi:hypothetical protein